MFVGEHCWKIKTSEDVYCSIVMRFVLAMYIKLTSHEGIKIFQKNWELHILFFGVSIPMLA